MTHFHFKWKGLADCWAAKPPYNLPTPSLSLGDSVIARAMPEAISNDKNATLNYSPFNFTCL